MTAPDMRNPIHFLAFGFGAGLSPKAPGTMGTLVAVPLWWLLATYAGVWGYLFATALVIAVGPYICGRTSADMGVHDHGGIVWDEIAGYLVTMCMLPVTWWAALAGFLFFRLFDIVKPWPIGWLDRRVAGGTGIMVDDLVAGVYAWLATAATLALLARFL